MDREQDRTKTETSACAFSFQRVIAEGPRPARPSFSASSFSSSCLFNCKGLAATQFRPQSSVGKFSGRSGQRQAELQRLPDSRPPACPVGRTLSAGPQGAGAPGQRQSLHLLVWNAFESLMKAISHPVPNDKKTGSQPKASGRSLPRLQPRGPAFCSLLLLSWHKGWCTRAQSRTQKCSSCPCLWCKCPARPLPATNRKPLTVKQDMRSRESPGQVQ